MTQRFRTFWPLPLALAFAAPAFNAGWSAEMFKLGPGGTYLAAATADDEARDPKLRQDAFNSGAEIRFEGRTRLDNGLEIGFHTEITRQSYAAETVQGLIAPGRGGEPASAVFVYVKSGLGTIALGESQGPAGAYGDIAPYLGQVSRDNDNQVSLPIFRPLELRGAAGADSASLRKVSYFTPRFGGVQFGVSFIPAANGANAITLDLPANIFETGSSKSLEFNANYKTQFRGVQVEFGGSYLNGRTALLNGKSNLEQWGASGALGYSLPRGGDLALAGSYRDSTCSNVLCLPGGGLSWLDSGTSNAWNLGLRYSLGSWNVGGYFLTGHRPDSFTSNLPSQHMTVFLQTSIGF
jgi:outer membrane protein OmpU